MAKEAIGSNAIFSGPQKGLSYIGKFVYGYSGTIEITGTTNPVTMLSFHSGKEIIKAFVQFQSIESGGNDLNFFIDFNGNRIATQSINSAKEFYHDAIRLIIPPLTLVKCSGLNIDVSTGRDSTATITGEVYK